MPVSLKLFLIVTCTCNLMGIIKMYMLFCCVLFFSSPEPKAQGELLWSLAVRRHRLSVHPSGHNL